MKKIVCLLVGLLSVVSLSFAQDTQVIQTAERGFPAAQFEWESTLHKNLSVKNKEGSVYEFNIKSPVTFTGLGVGWQTASQKEMANVFTIEHRVRKTGGAWSEWISGEGDINPDDTPTRLFWSDVMIADDGSAHNEFEVRLIAPAGADLRKVRIMVSDVSGLDTPPSNGTPNGKQGGGTNDESLTPMTVPCPAQPTMVMRSQWWGALPSDKFAYTPTYHTITHVFVHHTAGSNNYTNGAQTVRQTWDFHVNGRGWKDIGYNYLFDKFGNIYQGRYNPQFPSQDVRGAHAGQNNNGTIGVTFMGDFTSILPTTAALTSGTNFLAWYFKMRNLDPTGFAVKNTKNISRLPGHREGYAESTACPGNTFFPYLPTLRQNVKNIINQCGNTCNTPTSLSINNLTNNSVTLQWNSVVGATGYNVRYKPTSSSTWTNTTTTQTNINLMGLLGNTQYDWQVQAVCGSNTSTYSTTANFTTTANCAVTTNLTNSNITINSAGLSWSTVSGALSYTVRYRVLNTTTWTNVNVTGTSLNLTGLVPATNYEWQVATNCSNGSSAFTASKTFTTLVACGTATGATATNITTTSAQLQWTAVATAISYQIAYKPQNITTWTNMTTSTNTLTLNNLLPSTVYEWRIRATCSNNTSSQTGIFTFTTASLCNTVPSGLSSAGVSTSTATVSWGSVSGAVSYNLRYKPTLSSTWTVVSSIVGTSYNLSGLSASTAYEFQVLTNCSNGSSAYSSSANFTTQALCYDPNESNNSSTSATTLPIGTTKKGKICPSGDADWYKVTLSSTTNVRVTLSNLPADFDLDLYIGGVFVAVSNSAGTANDVIIRNNQAAGNLFYRVYTTGPTNDLIDYHIIAETSASPFRVGDDNSVLGAEDKSLITFYPNPTSGNINFVTSLAGAAQVKLELYNINGQLVHNSMFEAQGLEQENFGVDVSNLADGLYIAKVIVGDKISTQRIVIRK